MNSKYAERRQEHIPLFLHETALHEAQRPSRRNLMTGELPRQWECLKESYIGSLLNLNTLKHGDPLQTSQQW